MPIWTIRTRDDDGKDDKIKVRARDAGEAIRIAEVDINHVLVVKTEWGTWGDRGDGSAKWAPKNSIVRWLAMLAVAVYVWTLMLNASDSMFDEASMVSTIVFYALLIGAIIGGTVLYNKGKAGFERDKASVAEVLERDEIEVPWWNATWAKWVLLLVGIGMGIGMGAEAIMNVREFEISISYELFLPLAVLVSVIWDPRDLA